MEEQTRAVTTVPCERLSGKLEGEQCILAGLTCSLLNHWRSNVHICAVHVLSLTIVWLLLLPRAAYARAGLSN